MVSTSPKQISYVKLYRHEGRQNLIYTILYSLTGKQLLANDILFQYPIELYLVVRESICWLQHFCFFLDYRVQYAKRKEDTHSYF